MNEHSEHLEIGKSGHSKENWTCQTRNFDIKLKINKQISLKKNPKNSYQKSE